MQTESNSKDKVKKSPIPRRASERHALMLTQRVPQLDTVESAGKHPESIDPKNEEASGARRQPMWTQQSGDWRFELRGSSDLVASAASKFKSTSTGLRVRLALPADMHAHTNRVCV